MLVPSAQPGVLRRHNVAAVLSVLLDRGPAARIDLVRLTGLSAGTVTKLTAGLVESGLLREQTDRSGRDTGRPRVPLDIDPEGRAAIGVHIGLNFTRVVVADLRARPIEETVVEHASKGPDVVLGRAAELIGTAIASVTPRHVIGVGVSMGGRVDHKTGEVVEHQPLGWRGIEVRDELSRRLGAPVEFDNAVRAIALFETWFGAGRDVGSLVNLFVGNVVGAALVVGREIHRGPGSASGNLTHLRLVAGGGQRCECGRTDCFQVLASDLAVLRDARTDGLIGPREDLPTLVDLARTGETGARRLLSARADRVGQVVAVLADVMNPDVVVLSGSMTRTPEYLGDVHRAAVAQSGNIAADNVADRVRLALRREHSLSVASAALLLARYYRDPLAFEPRLAQAMTGVG